MGKVEAKKAEKEFVKRRNLRRDRRGALEGLPLYMVILVVIAAVAMVILLNWTKSVQHTDLKRIVVEPDTIDDGEKTSVTIRAYDTKGNPLEGVTIILDGCGVSKVGKTSSTGKYTTSITPDLAGESYGTIDVTAKYTGTTLVELHDEIIVS